MTPNQARFGGLFVLLLSGCAGMETYHITPERDTATITRVYATPEQIGAFCSKLTGSPSLACTIWVGERSVQFLPQNTNACVNGHETEHSFSGAFH